MSGFERTGKGPNTSDERGKIQITITHVVPIGGGQRHKKGNITRTMTVRDATVSEVKAAIERALFGQEEA